MMMDCPRCGFSQPQDRYCANCGLDVENYVAKPVPWLVRTVQNPNLHLSLIAALLVLVTGYIIYSQSERFGREVGNLFHGTPLASREAGDPQKAVAVSENVQMKTVHEDERPAASGALSVEGTETTVPTAASIPELQKIEVSYWEVPRDALATLISGAEKVGESAEGRAYYWASAAKQIETLQTAGRQISLPRTLSLTPTGGQLTVETPSSGADMFQFGIYFQVSKAAEAKDFSLKWESTMVMPAPETQAEAASQAPAKALTEVSLTGNSTMTSTSAMIVVIEPSNRSPRPEYVAKAGSGPWSIFTSEAFRGGVSEWVILVKGQ